MRIEAAWRAARVTVRRGERRATAAACWTLLSAMAGHALMETARDALFLQALPATRLPWVYLLIAVFALVLVTLHERAFARSRPGTASLSLLLGASALATLAIAGVVASRAPWTLYALYAWSGTLASLLLVVFWTHVDGLFTIRQARRLLPIIALAGIAGATCGSAVARAIAATHGADMLVPAAAACFAIASIGPWIAPVHDLSRAPAAPAGRAPAAGRPAGLTAAAWKEVASDPYLRLVACVVVLATVALTLVDFLFKSSAAREIDPARLASFFATAYLLMNASSMAAQLLLSRRLMERLGPSRTLALLPALMLLGTGAVAAGAALAGAVVAKIADGALRHSVHRTALEVVQVPVADELRRRTKAVLDIAGQRLSQALASLGLLALGPLALRSGLLASLIAGASAAWIAAALVLDRRYVKLLQGRVVPASRRRPRSSDARRPSPAVPLGDLIERLQRRSTRASAREALAATGDAGLAAVTKALDDPATPWRLRRHLPRTIARFEADAAAAVLMVRLDAEADGTVRYQMLRALGALLASDPALRLDHAVLGRALAREAVRARTLVGWRHALRRNLRRRPELDSPDMALLVELTRAEEANTLERISRLLGLLHPAEDVRALYRSLHGGAELRADATELLERLLEPTDRRVVLPLLDDLSDGDRAALAGAEPRERSVEDVVAEILSARGTWLPAVAARAAATAGMVAQAREVARLAERAAPLQRPLFEEALAALAESAERRTHG